MDSRRTGASDTGGLVTGKGAAQMARQVGCEREVRAGEEGTMHTAGLSMPLEALTRY